MFSPDAAGKIGTPVPQVATILVEVGGLMETGEVGAKAIVGYSLPKVEFFCCQHP